MSFIGLTRPLALLCFGYGLGCAIFKTKTIYFMHKIILIVSFSITKCNAFFRHFQHAKLGLQVLPKLYQQLYVIGVKSRIIFSPGKVFYNKLSTRFSHSHLIIYRHLVVQLICKAGVTCTNLKYFLPIYTGDWE